MTYKQAVEDFVNTSNPFDNYWELELAWSTYTDALCKNRTITQRQFQNWATPCTPETFNKFNHKFSDNKYDRR